MDLIKQEKAVCGPSRQKIHSKGAIRYLIYIIHAVCTKSIFGPLGRGPEKMTDFPILMPITQSWRQCWQLLVIISLKLRFLIWLTSAGPWAAQGLTSILALTLVGVFHFASLHLSCLIFEAKAFVWASSLHTLKLTYMSQWLLSS